MNLMPQNLAPYTVCSQQLFEFLWMRRAQFGILSNIRLLVFEIVYVAHFYFIFNYLTESEVGLLRQYL